MAPRRSRVNQASLPRARFAGWPEPNIDTGGEFSGSAAMPVSALVRQAESARESGSAEGLPQNWGCKHQGVFSRLISDRGWTGGLDCEGGENRG